MTKTKDLQKMLADGRISRRDFFGRATALGISAAAIPALMSSAAHASPKKGGRLRAGVGHGSTTDSLDPATYENGFTAIVNYAHHNHLGEVDANGEIQPDLAESWEASPDAKTWVFKLRDGVEFHNGKSLTAEDVVASVDYHRNKDTKSPAKALLKQMTSIKADGKNSVVCTLEAGNADFPHVISDYHVAIKASKDGKITPTDGIGTGA
jgi:peptide/nickel transport system substrate-binding protein